MNRRIFLGGSIGGLVAGITRAEVATPEEFRNRLVGPICSVPTVYRADQSLDLEGFRRIIETGMASGCKVFTLTAGNNQYARLTYPEIQTLTRALVDGVARRGLVIAATGPWATDQSVDYCRFAERAGADAVQIALPTGPPEKLPDHFRAIASATARPLVLHGQVPIPQLIQLMELPSIVGYKEEYAPLYTRDVFERFGKRLNIFAGGQKGNFLMYQPYGMRAYYSTFSTFAPDVARRFWNAVRQRKTDSAVSLILKYDVPFFRGTPVGVWSHAYWRATMEAHGLCGRHLRAPDKALTDEQAAGVRRFQQELGLLRVSETAS